MKKFSLAFAALSLATLTACGAAVPQECTDVEAINTGSCVVPETCKAGGASYQNQAGADGCKAACKSLLDSTVCDSGEGEGE